VEQLIRSLHKAPQYKAVGSSASKLASVGISPLKSKPFRSGSLHSPKLRCLPAPSRSWSAACLIR